MSGIGREIKRLREERGWSQAELAVYSGSSQPTVNQIESGKRNPSTRTLEKLAAALGVEVPAFFPKGQAPLPEFDQEQRRSVPEALNSYMSRRAKSLEAELKDENSPHFKNATTATVWVAGVQREVKDWADWAAEEWSVLMPQRGGFFNQSTLLDAFNILGHLMTFHAITRKAERRITAMNEQPDALAQKRLEKDRREAQESERRLQELRAASG
jgi:transcriptional regulator with XRE-family HTH domain